MKYKTIVITKDSVASINSGMVAMYLDMAAKVDPSNPANADRFPDEEIQAKYEERNRCLWGAFGFAAAAGWSCGVRIDEKEPTWPVMYIDLPEVGQVSWHLPAYAREWDGHTVTEKYWRVKEFSSRSQEGLSDWADSLAPRDEPEVAPGQ